MDDFQDRAEEALMLLFAAVHNYAICVLDAEGNVVVWHPCAGRLLGYSSDEIVGQHFSRFYTGEDMKAGQPQRDLEQAVMQGQAEAEGYRIRMDGSRFWAKATLSSMSDPGGKLWGYGLVIRDMTEERRSNALFRSVVDHAENGIITTDEKGVIVLFNREAEKLFRYSGSEVIGQNISILMPEPFRSEHDGYLARYLRTGQAKIIGIGREVQGRRKDGSIFPASLAVSEFFLEDRRHFIGIMRDLTEQRKLEEQLRQSQKMDAVGQLAGGVAHDFNNLLTIIMGFSEILLKMLPADDPKRKFVSDIRQAGDRAASLTNQLLAFSRKQILEVKILNLNEVIGNIERMLRRLIGEDVLLTTDYDPDLKQVKVDPSQIEQVVINLALNARDAMLNGGRLTIMTRNVELDEKRCQQLPDSRPGHYVEVSVTDTGCGMTPEVQARIFEPFFTTKEVGKGTGLGLATAFGVVRQNEGSIAVESKVGVGTSFKVYLPALKEIVVPSDSKQGTGTARRGTETILVVEDEEGVRGLVRFALENFGYSVLEASNGREALSLVHAHPGPLHLVITDVVMPEMSGRQLVESLAKQHPAVKLLFMSGYTDDAVVRHGIKELSYAFLQKPFSMDALAKKVRDVLDEKK